MDLLLDTKINLIVQNHKKGSYLPFTVTVTRGTFLKSWPNFRNMPLSKILDSRVTVYVLEAVYVHLSEKKCFMVIAEYIFTQIDQLLSRTVQILILTLLVFVQD